MTQTGPHDVPGCGVIQFTPWLCKEITYLAGTKAQATRVSSLQAQACDSMGTQGLIDFPGGGWVALTKRGRIVAAWVANGGVL